MNPSEEIQHGGNFYDLPVEEKLEPPSSIRKAMMGLYDDSLKNSDPSKKIIPIAANVPGATLEEARRIAKGEFGAKISLELQDNTGEKNNFSFENAKKIAERLKTKQNNGENGASLGSETKPAPEISLDEVTPSPGLTPERVKQWQPPAGETRPEPEIGITPPAPLNLSGEPEEMSKSQTEPQPTPEPITEPTTAPPEPFDADKIAPLTSEESKPEDVTDILNQPQSPIEVKKEEILVQEPTPELKREGAMPRMGNIINTGEVPISEEKKEEFFEKPRLVVKNENNPDQNRSGDNSNPEWLKEKQPGEVAEWEELERLRFHLARAENQKATTIGEMINLGILRDEYEAKKQKLASVLRERLTGVSEGPLTKDQQKFVNDTVFDELVQKENEAYLTTLKENRSETWKDKGKEALRTVAGLKLVSWYLKQNKWTRVAVNTGLFGIAVGVGTFIGGGAALTAMGVTGLRGARAVGSVLGSGLGIGVDKRYNKQIEEVDKEEKEAVELIKNDPNLSVEEKTKKYTETKEKYDKERKWITKRKAMLMVGGGIIGGNVGAVTGELLSTYYGGGGSASALEVKKDNSDISSHRIQRGAANFSPTSEINIRQTLFIEQDKDQGLIDVELKSDKIEKIRFEELNQVSTESPKPEVESQVSEAPKMSFKQENLVHKVKDGDSTWNILKEILKHDERFKNFSGNGTPQEIAEQVEAKQTRVLHDVLAKALKNHDEYHIGPNGEIKVGDKVDFSKLFNNTEELDEIIKDAENLKPTQVSSIIESNRKIETWLKESPGKKFDLDEIMSTKPKVFEMPKPEIVEPELPDAPELQKPNISGAEAIETIKPVAPDLLETPPAPKSDLVENGNTMFAGVAGLALVKKLNTEDGTAAQEEVTAAKRKLGILEENRDGLRTMSSDTLEVAQNAEIREAVEGVLNNEVNDIYGESSFLGLKKVAGVDTKEWKTIAGLPARRVLEYFKSPETSDLPKTILAELQTSEKHRKLVERINELVVEAGKHSNADFSPKGDESIVDYLRRIGGSLMRQQIESRTLKRAA